MIGVTHPRCFKEAIKMRRWLLHDLFNKQVLRAFKFIPSLGWEEVSVENVQQLFSRDLTTMNRSDFSTYSHTIDGKLSQFVAVFYCNKNKRDVNFVNNVLKDAIQNHMEEMAQA